MDPSAAKRLASLRRQRETMAVAGQDTSLIDKRIAALEEPRITPANVRPYFRARQTKRD